MNMQSIFKAVAAVLFGMTSMSLVAEGSWTRKADMPTARFGLTSSVVDGKIYAIGGATGPGIDLRAVEEYDPATNTWTKKANMPTAVCWHSASAVDGKIYAIGFPGEEVPMVEEYDPATDTWTRKADLPTPRWALSASAVNGKIYAIGGASDVAGLGTVEEYDPATDTWTRKADMPTPRILMSTSVVSGIIYAIGGARSQGGSALSTVEAYDPATDTWTTKAPMPTARGFFSTCVVNGKIYAVGGCAHPYNSGTLSRVEAYDPATDTWTKMDDMPTSRKALATSAVNGKIYAIGGNSVPGFETRISTVEEYDLTPPPPDFNGDGRIDGKDVLILAEYWGQDDPICDIAPPPFGDSLVDVQDLIALAEYIGKEVNDPTLIAHWKLDEAEGTVAYDSAGGNDGTVMAIPSWQPDAGKVGGALEFDGTTFVVSDSVLNPKEGPFSVFAWVKGGTPGQGIISQQEGTNWLMADPATGALMTELNSGGRLSKALCSDAVITDGVWHRVGFTWDGSNRSLYVDDVFVAEDTDVGLAECCGGLNIGCGPDMTVGTFFSGLIDDVRIYSRAVKP